MKTARLFLPALVLLIVSGQAREIVVPDDAPTIRLALLEAEAGDVVQLRPGTVSEWSLNLPSGVTIRGDLNAPESYVIDASGEQRALRAEGVSDVRLEGVTISGGNANGPSSYSASGGGLFVSRSQMVLDRVRFVGNRADASGGGMRVAYGDVELVDCEFLGCTAVKGGGAIDLSYDSVAHVRGSTFVDNSAAWGGAISARAGTFCYFERSGFRQNRTTPPQEIGGAFFADHAARVTFIHCVLADNTARLGGAARLTGAASGFLNCTIDGNRAAEAGAGIMVREGTLALDHTIISFNEGVSVTVEDGDVFVLASDIHGNLDGDWVGPLADLRDLDGNFDADPQYCGEDDYELAATSPCAEENNSRGLVGALDVGCENVGITLDAFDVTTTGREVRLSWMVFDANDFEFRLTGQTVDGPTPVVWTVSHARRDADGRFEAVDRPAPDMFPVEYRLAARTGGGDWRTIGTQRVAEPPPGVASLQIESVYPNPFNPRVTAAFTLGLDSRVRAAVYDLQGRRVRTLLEGPLGAGRHEVQWDGRDARGRPKPAGSYLLRIEGDDLVATRKLLLVK